MKSKMRFLLGSISFSVFFLSASLAGAQQTQKPAPQNTEAYTLARETVLQGTVVSFTAASSVPPAGAHVTIQTASGLLEVHLGNAGLLKQAGISLVAGDSVRLAGESLTYGSGSFFAARALQKGNQFVVLRNTNGIPLSTWHGQGTSTARFKRQGGA